MHVLIINTDYGPFLQDLYAGSPGLAAAPYAAQMAKRNESLFGCADFYSRGFRAHGHEAWEVHANNGHLQTAWKRENGRAPLWPTSLPGKRKLSRVLRKVRKAIAPGAAPGPGMSFDGLNLEDILVDQVRALKPDVVLNQAVSEVHGRVLKRMRPYVGLIVGQIASPLPDDPDYSAYDMMVSSLPNFVSYYRKLGIPAEMNRLGFNPPVAALLGGVERDISVSFVGSVTSAHGERLKLLEHLVRNTDIQLWGRLHNVPDNSPIVARYHTQAWGTDMYRLLGRSKMTINQHIDLAEGYANNMRLFEATGMGTLLITDWKDNIADIFEPGKEIVCYRSWEECADLVHYYLAHDNEREKIAMAGQARVLRDHTFSNRAKKLAALFSKALKAKAA